VTALIALNRPDQLRFHLGAVENGVTEPQTIEAITHLASARAGRNAMTAILITKELFSGP